MDKVLTNMSSFAARMTRLQKMTVFLVVDALLVPISMLLALLVAGEDLKALAVAHPVAIWLMAGGLTVAGAGISFLLGLPRIRLNVFEQYGILPTATYAALVGLIAGGHTLLLGGRISLQEVAIFTMTLTILSVGSRLLMRNVLVRLYSHGRTRQRILIYGAGQTGVQLATALQTDDAVMPVGFMDDNKTLHNITVAGLPVYAPFQIDTLMKQDLIDRVVLAMPSISRPKQARLARRLTELGCDVSALPSFATLVEDGELGDRMQSVNPTDFLGRDVIGCDLRGLCDIYAGRTVMITGAGGSIGSELTRQILGCRPKRIVLFEISEYALYQLDHELQDLGAERDEVEVIPVLGSVIDQRSLRRAMEQHGVEIVLHAAAYKHVPLVEQNRLVGLHNNVIGTKLVAEAARETGATHFILISTDKAVNPTNIMGASKRLAELFVQDLASRCDMQVAIVRFGNVLGSSGSVVPLFEEQISRGGPVTVTHQEVSRYFMSLAEAARLVLLAGNYAGDEGGSGDLFLLDMGEPVPIVRLARQMIAAAGYTVCDADNPDGDIEIRFTGLRPGEKLHEELAMQGHAVYGTKHPKINRVEERRLSEIEAASALQALWRAIERDDCEGAVDVIRRFVGPSPYPEGHNRLAQPPKATAHTSDVI
ncbi:polysaccharide biosynthesis protein [Thalassorhabdomicrobium marinisediminis]|uniref:polysaccharide biosynthesis protein n=1 Tax=Thalassorhabdomicrobium marinisediminis TaxID=2170577 RepID=UPI00248F7112|nr:nucleoside-diphosphate sugar epimerase/dehydratase [Thalassorhabdomicrobium marinisediminis]